MTVATYETVTSTSAVGASRTSLVITESISAPSTRPGRQRIPASIPRSQAYYWKRAWQDGEAETLVSLRVGNGRRFGSGREAIRWLLSEDDD